MGLPPSGRCNGSPLPGGLPDRDPIPEGGCVTDFNSMGWHRPLKERKKQKLETSGSEVQVPDAGDYGRASSAQLSKSQAR